MKSILKCLFGICLLLISACGTKTIVSEPTPTVEKIVQQEEVVDIEQTEIQEEKENDMDITKDLAAGVYAVIDIMHGDEALGQIVCEIYTEQTPITTDSFLGLAEGTQAFIDVKTREKAQRPFYDGLIFHRVIENFMIQGGDPTGTGTSGPGYKFQDEIVKSLVFDKPGVLAMANAGPNTNGSQFFITVAPTPWLNGRHTIFGQVVKGMDIVQKISKVPTGAMDKPQQPVVMKTVSIVRK